MKIGSILDDNWFEFHQLILDRFQITDHNSNDYELYLWLYLKIVHSLFKL